MAEQRFSHLFGEVVVSNDAAQVRVSHLFAEMIVGNDDAQVRVSQLFAEVICDPVASGTTPSHRVRFIGL